ncbi:MAG: SH3 domain-containing protein [Deltaproteobacteria bacterium]|nr:SH3 domain-containing protein [Deltaproteobacteria bacterium]
MKRVKMALCAAIMVCLFGGIVFAIGGKMMSVQVKEAHIREAPSFLSEITGKFVYGDRVRIAEESGAWRKVGPAEGVPKGWMHASALTKRKVVLQPGEADVEEAATSDELALAGKGFNKQAEEQFSRDNPDADYAWIDWMEQIVASHDDMTRFQEKGGLSPKGGPQ